MIGVEQRQWGVQRLGDSQVLSIDIGAPYFSLTLVLFEASFPEALTNYASFRFSGIRAYPEKAAMPYTSCKRPK